MRKQNNRTPLAASLLSAADKAGRKPPRHLSRRGKAILSKLLDVTDSLTGSNRHAPVSRAAEAPARAAKPAR